MQLAQEKIEQEKQIEEQKLKQMELQIQQQKLEQELQLEQESLANAREARNSLGI